MVCCSTILPVVVVDYYCWVVEHRHCRQRGVGWSGLKCHRHCPGYVVVIVVVVVVAYLLLLAWQRLPVVVVVVDAIPMR